MSLREQFTSGYEAGRAAGRAEAEALLREARDYVVNEIAAQQAAYKGYEALCERKTRPDKELLSRIDTFLKGDTNG